MKKIFFTLSISIFTLAVMGQTGPASTPSPLSSMVQNPPMGITTWRTIAPNPIYDVIIAKGTESYTHNAHSFIYPNYSLPRIDTGAERMVFIDDVGRLKVSSKFPFDGRYVKTEADPIWISVSSNYRTKWQNDSLYQPLGSYIQSISRIGGRINLSLGGGQITLPDSSDSNELQDLSILGNNITISNGNTISLPAGISYTAGTGINIGSGVISNTLPDQTVSLTAGTGISISGTYPNFTIINTYTPTVNYSPGRALNTNFTPSVTRPTLGVYTFTCSTTNPLLIGTSSANVFVEYSTNGGSTWNSVAQNGSSNGVGITVTVALTVGQSTTISIPMSPNYLYRLRSAISGTASVSITNQIELNL